MVIQAPLGIQLRHGSFGVAQIPLPLASVSSKDTSNTCIEDGELCDTLSMKKRTDKVAGANGLEGVSIECANLLNNGVDVFMISFCILSNVACKRIQLSVVRGSSSSNTWAGLRLTKDLTSRVDFAPGTTLFTIS